MGISRQQIWVTALVSIAVDVNRRTGQIGIVRTLDVTTVGEGELCLAYRGRDDRRREPVAIVAADFILLLTEVEVVVCQMLIAQSYLCIDFAKRATILQEGS